MFSLCDKLHLTFLWRSYFAKNYLIARNFHIVENIHMSEKFIYKSWELYPQFIHMTIG